MKRLLAIFLCGVLLFFCFGACTKAPEDTESTTTGMTERATEALEELSCVADETDIQALEDLYSGRTPFYGEMHDHSNSGGRSDGRMTLSVWKSVLPSLNMDFATIVDHKQVRHMVLPEWDETVFIGGTEAANTLKGSDLEQNNFHYNMIFTDHEALMEILTEYEAFGFSGTALDGEFPRYPHFTREEMEGLVKAIQEKGGMFVHVHPKSPSYLKSDDPLDYWFGDWTGIEVLYTYKADRNSERVQANYKLWTDLLARGKKVWATGGNDEHGMPSDKAVCVVYAEERLATSYFSHIRVGDFTCGGVGIRMCVGDTVTGYETDFTGQRLVFSIGDFHQSLVNPYHTYRVDLINDTGTVFSQEISCEETTYFAVDTENCMFYRVEVWDTTDNSRIAIGNPIWNTKTEG